MSLEALKAHLFETLEGVKNLSDDTASPCEKISIDQAKQIVSVADTIIDIYKVQVDAFKTFAGLDNVANPASMMKAIGVATDDNVKLLEP
jgi:hypothetical protein